MKIFEASSLKDTDVVLHMTVKDGGALEALMQRALADPKTLTKLRKGSVQYKLADKLIAELPIW